MKSFLHSLLTVALTVALFSGVFASGYYVGRPTDAEFHSLALANFGSGLIVGSADFLPAEVSCVLWKHHDKVASAVKFYNVDYLKKYSEDLIETCNTFPTSDPGSSGTGSGDASQDPGARPNSN